MLEETPATGERRGVGHRLVAITLAVLVLAAASYLLLGEALRPAPEPDQTTARVSRGDLTVSIAATGQVSPVTVAHLDFSADGKVSRVLVKPATRRSARSLPSRMRLSPSRARSGRVDACPGEAALAILEDGQTANARPRRLPSETPRRLP
jgi:hypothetical protein